MEILWLDGNDASIGAKACEEISKRGIVLVRNIKSEQSLTEISKHFGQVFNPRHGSPNGVANIHPDHTLEGKGYTRTALLLHTDRSGMDNPPRFLITTVKKQSESGGHSTFVNGKHLQAQILSEDPKLFQLLRDSRMTQFQQEDRSFKCLPMFYGESKIRCRFDDGIYFNHSLAEKLPHLMRHLAKLQVRVAFKEGEGYILDNHWWLHGRDGFNGDREVLRLLINPVIIDALQKEEGKNTSKLILPDIDTTLLDFPPRFPTSC
ncbi:probable gamma-butyrobetaine dioxygenase [Folsomia candida]|uniref:Putative gamma-butyrobetaine dioxygenase n=1 Tax=Folsomia candida TaxID=158441 RepID=A0A226EQI9_FOLCA|nr:probable gamma-butyrobetaine dioxygenase [Folsomia candida]OXA59769.1 putative gamma-butyrobetaine dioxygenase [Folsomia candida]